MEYRGSRVVVSGDYKRQPDPTCDPFDPVPCDVFVTEATFALPVFRHPAARARDRPPAGERGAVPRAHPRRRLLRAGQVPAADRAAARGRLGRADLPARRAGRRSARSTSSSGVALGRSASGDGGGQGRSCRAPSCSRRPRAVTDRWARRLAEPVVALASGWMRVRQRAKSRGVELPLVISDHADWDELNATVDEVGAPEVWVTHGREEALIHCMAAARHARPRAAAGRLRRRGRRGAWPEQEPSGGARVIAFADLLERLVFTPGRNAKIALLRRYFATQPDPDRGIGLAAVTGELRLHRRQARPDPRSRRRAHRSRAVRLVLRLRGRPRRDGRADVAGRSRPTPRRRRSPRWWRRWRPTPESRAARRSSRAGSTPPTPRSGSRCSSSSPARCGSAPRRGWPRSRWPRWPTGRIEPDEIEEVWHGLAPPYAPLFAWLEGRGARPDPADAPVFRPPMLAHPLEPPDLRRARCGATSAPNGSGTASACSSSPPRAASGSTRAARDDISAAFPEIVEAMNFEARARRRAAGDPRRRGRAVRRSAAAAQPQGRRGQDAARLPGRRPALRHPVRRRRGSARRCPSTPAARGWKRGANRVRPRRMDALAARSRSTSSTSSPRSATTRAPPRSRG